MKKLSILLIALVCFGIITNAQTKYSSIMPSKMNVLYLGVDNPLEVAVSDISIDDFSLTTNNGTITGSKGNYMIKPANVGISEITILSKDKKEISKKMFRVKQIPYPIAKISNKSGGSISKSEILAQTFVIADMENFDFDVKFTVRSFTMICTRDSFIYDYKSMSSNITKEMKEEMQKLEPEKKVIFDEIIAVGPDGSMLKLDPIVFIIRE